MSYAALFAFPVAAAALALNGHSLAAETAVPPGWSSQAPPTTTEADSRMITVLTYNVRGLPWPLALNRAKRLRDIGHELESGKPDFDKMTANQRVAYHQWRLERIFG